MEVLEAINGVHDVHLRDKYQRAITAVQRTIDLYGCAHTNDSHVMQLPMSVCLSGSVQRYLCLVQSLQPVI